MILGFAHITRNHAGNGAFPIPNAPQKWPLMERKAKCHVISLHWETDRDPDGRVRGVPLEIVQYDTGVVDCHLNRLDVEGDRIFLGARNVWAEFEFFSSLGFRSFAGGSPFGPVYLEFTGPVRQWSAKLEVRHDPVAPVDPPLDVSGYAALGFYSTDVEADCARAMVAGGRSPTEPFTVTLDREMKIIMLRSPEGTIVELIQVKP